MTQKIIMIMSVVIFTANTCFAGQWLWHHNEEIKGQVVEADTLKPIGGALIIALWKLEDVVNEGPGGYDRVEVVESDKTGNFVIPSWASFKPWQLLYKIEKNSPYILIFKPGYKPKFSNKPARDGHPDTIALTAEEKRRIKDSSRLDPSKLKRITNDKERLESIDELERAGFPGRHFSKNQLRKIFKSYEIEVNNLSDSMKEKQQLKKNICDDKNFYIRGGECEN